MRSYINKLLILALVITALVAVGGGQVFAAPSPFDIDVTPLPNVTAGPSKIQAVLTIVFTVIGALSLLMVTIGGFRYVISQGDPQAVTKAKDTIIFALVGLLVSITAVAIVTFVLGKV